MKLILFISVFSATLGMFQFGFNTGVINAPQKVLEEFIAKIYQDKNGTNISDDLKLIIWSVIVGIFAIGGMLGGYIGPTIAERFGRRRGLILNNISAVIGAILMSCSASVESYVCLIIGRLLIGFNCGANTALVPMYLSEISPLYWRGGIGIVAQLAVTVGLLVSQIMGQQSVLGNKDLWPYLFGFALFPALGQLLTLPFCPESPRYYLLDCNDENKSRRSLQRLRGALDVEEDISEMKNEARAQEEEIRLYGKISSVRELFNHSWLREPLIIAIMMQLSQQLSGINVVFYYSTNIFLSAQIPKSYADYATMGVGLVMVIMTLLSIPLIDKLGRRTLHLTGLGGMFWMGIFLTFALVIKSSFEWVKYASVVSILLYTLFFAIGPGPLPWMITSELFTQGARPAAVSVAVLVNWSTNFAVGLSFPFIQKLLQDYLFVPYILLIAVIWIYIYFKLPETKNRTFEEISSIFKRPTSGYGTSGALPITTPIQEREEDLILKQVEIKDGMNILNTEDLKQVEHSNGVENGSKKNITQLENNMLKVYCFYYGQLDKACKNQHNFIDQLNKTIPIAAG